MTIKALTFDVFGTVVDWRSSIIREGERLGKAKGLAVDWAEFADAWRAGYGPAMYRVRTGELPWTKIDVLHRLILEDILLRFKISTLSEAEKVDLNLVWHRLDPWPDAVGGLLRLKSKFLIATLSNGNVALLANMAKYGGLPWDCILSAELAHHYKPDPETYLSAADLLDCEAQEVMMVAAHQGDLRAAAKVGMKTAFVLRPFERGRGVEIDLTPDPDFNYVAQDFHDLANQLSV
jgi:2-haloacid dehalogenase